LNSCRVLHRLMPDPNRTPGEGALQRHPNGALAAPAVSFVGMIRSGSRVERPFAPQSQPSAEETPTGKGSDSPPALRVNCGVCPNHRSHSRTP
jgi:hypothetical protein